MEIWFNAIMCQLWIHPECANEADNDIVTIWSCSTCRAIPPVLDQVLE